MPRARYQGAAGDRVQTRDGITGIVYSCRGAKGLYLKVKLADGRWVWPGDVIAESSGRYLASCGECGIDYRTDAPNSHTCPNCVGRERRSQRPDYERGGNATFAGLPIARPFTPAPVQVNASEEQRAQVERGRVSDDEGSPF